MEVHKPKPIHNWREFIAEVGVIIVGVLIALGAEQTVEAIHHHKEVHDLRRALDQELAWNLARMKDYAEESDCARQRLDALDRWSESSASARPLQLDGPILSPPGHIFRTAAWRSAAGATIDRMPLKERIAYAQFYDGVDNNDGLRKRAADLWDQVSEFEGASSLTPDQVRRVSHHIKVLRRLTQSVVANFNTWKTVYAPPLGIRIEDAPSIGADKASFAQARAAFCKPLLAR